MRVFVSARKLTMPPSCPCCGGSADSDLSVSYTRTTGKRVIREKTRGWTFPYCQGCIVHSRLWNHARAIAATVTTLGVIGGVVLAFAASVTVGLIAFGCSIVFAMIMATRKRADARAACTPTCITAAESVSYLGWDGSIQEFDFTSDAYAALFARANGRTLVNVSADLRRLLDAPMERPRPRQAASLPPMSPTHALPARVADVPRPSGNDDVLEWIARIESFKGPVARRNALTRALGEISDPEARRSLILAACKIEVAAVMDKVDTLATPAAKRRHLEKAISDLRSDNIPDDLQAEELAMLEEALGSVGAR